MEFDFAIRGTIQYSTVPPSRWEIKEEEKKINDDDTEGKKTENQEKRADY